MSESTHLQAIFFRDFSSSYIPHILKEMYLDSVYLPYEKYIKDGIVLDVGGNIGLFTLFALSKGARHVYLVEPAKQHLEVIRTMLAYNKISDKVTVLPYALSHKNGEVDLYHSQNVTAHSLHHGMDNTGTKELVRAITIEDLLKEIRVDQVDFMKLDPEGEEFAIIGSKAFANTMDKFRAMVVELHSWPGINYQQPMNTLTDLGFKLTRMQTDAFVFGAEKI